MTRSKAILKMYNYLTRNWFALFLMLALVSPTFAQDDIEAGKTTFRNYCQSCHNKDMKSASTGPALGGVEERWSEYPREDLYQWIRYSQSMVAAGHPRALELWAEWQPTVMNNFPALTDADIENVLAYIDDVVNAVPATAAVTGVPGAEVEDAGVSPIWYWMIFGLLLLVALLMSRVINNLNRLVANKEGTVYESKSLLDTLTSKGLVSFLIFGLIVFAGYTTVNNAVDLGRQQGYAPEQPIKFSHKTHAGLHKIDCQYCHDGARRSKHAVIPAGNTCINCHAAIKNGSQYGTAEITKIYASVGYDPNGAGKYIEDYDDMSPADREALYKKWIADQYRVNNELEKDAVLDEEGQQEVERQWEGIYNSLTNDQKKSVSGGVEWVRIHNLPDHVYFNHAQHVTVGKIECQQCHGKVEEMEVLQQHAPLSMGWCINCHRQTEVQFKGNDYYDTYAQYHNELADGDKEKVTVEDVGGLECQKCHY